MALVSGLTTTEQLTTYMSEKSRRRVFYQFPNGAAPILGLLSMLETQAVDKTEFGWWEDRFVPLQTQTASIGSGEGPFSASGSDTALTAAGFNLVAGTTYRLRVDSTEGFRVTNVIEIQDALSATSTKNRVTGIVSAIISATKLEFVADQSITGLENGDGSGGTTSAVDLYVTVIGTANAEAATSSGDGLTAHPVEITNYTQIFRTAFTFSRNALKMGLRFDSTGEYKTKAKKNSMYHMIDIEHAFVRGKKTRTTSTDSNGISRPTHKTGGILYFLELWEAGSTYSNTAATADTDENKRIYENSSGVITNSIIEEMFRRLFAVCTNSSFDKLCLCGDQHLSVLQRYAKDQSVLQTDTKTTDATWGPTWVTFQTIYGKVHFKTHPLFRSYGWQKNGLYLDMGCFKYTHINDSDTDLLANRQANDFDGRKDEWLTDAGLECQQPEANVFAKNFTSYTP